MFEYFESNPDAFFKIWLATVVYVVVVFYFGGRWANKTFRDAENQTIRFRERGASGRSLKSFVTKLGGASRVLEVVVTDKELWIKGIWPAFTFIDRFFDLTRKESLDRVKTKSTDGSRVILTVHHEGGASTDIELQLRNSDDFLRAIDA